MKNNKPDLLWIVALIIVLGAATSSLLGEAEAQMTPQQAGIIVR